MTAVSTGSFVESSHNGLMYPNAYNAKKYDHVGRVTE